MGEGGWVGAAARVRVIVCVGGWGHARVSGGRSWGRFVGWGSRPGKSMQISIMGHTTLPTPRRQLQPAGCASFRRATRLANRTGARDSVLAEGGMPG